MAESVSTERVPPDCWTISMSWSDVVVNGIDVTGTIKTVLMYDGNRALVRLDTGVSVIVPTTHQPSPGDLLVEGELAS